jgi:hypothetical protein
MTVEWQTNNSLYWNGKQILKMPVIIKFLKKHDTVVSLFTVQQNYDMIYIHLAF